MSASNRRAKRSRGAAFLPIGIVFAAVAIAVIFRRTKAWIASFTMGITFLILGMQKPQATMSVHPASLHETDSDPVIALNTFLSLFLGKGTGSGGL